MRIFINYRRSDSAGHAGRLHDSLQLRCPDFDFFMDVDSIGFGDDFVDAVSDALAHCEVVIALIGKSWIDTTSAGGERRLDDPTDYVRVELEAALARGIRIVPALVQGAEMPAESGLPEHLKPLARRNALELSDTRWAYDVDRLAEVLTGLVKSSSAAASGVQSAESDLLGDYAAPEAKHDLPFREILAEEPPPSSHTSAPGFLSGVGTAPGTCGELVQGLLGPTQHFHVTCPIRKSSTVRLRMRPAAETSITGLEQHQDKIELALLGALDLLDLPPHQIFLEHWSDLDIGKGMGSSTADVLAAARALADAAGAEFSADQLAKLATSIESSDGTMYPGIAVMNQKTGELVRPMYWWPQFLIVMLIPDATFNTESADFTGKDQYADEFATLLSSLTEAAATRTAQPFADAGTRSCEINQRFVPNAYSLHLLKAFEDYGALGVNTAHTGTVCGLLFDPDAGGAAAEAQLALRRELPADVRIEMTLTPPEP